MFDSSSLLLDCCAEETAADDQEPGVGLPVPQEEEGVHAGAGGAAAGGPVREREAEEGERLAEAAAGPGGVRGEGWRGAGLGVSRECSFQITL